MNQPDSAIEYVLRGDWPLPVWLSVVVGLLLTAGVLALYFTERGRAPRPRRVLLAATRVALLLLVGWMLAGWSWLRFQSDLPELVLLLDRSASMQTSDLASGSQPSRWQQAVAQLSELAQRQDIQRRYRLRWYTVADDVQPVQVDAGDIPAALSQLAPDGEQSRLGDGLIQVVQLQTGAPTAAIVFISDGIVTSGARLQEAGERARRSAVPVYALAAGQQLPHPDLQIADVLADQVVFLGDQVTLLATVQANDIERQTATVKLTDIPTGRLLDSQTVELSARQPQQQVQLNFVPTVAGPATVRVEVTAAANETNSENNFADRIIEVRDQTLRVLLVYRMPSFEFRFLKTLLERSQQLGDSAHKAFELSAVLQDADAEHIAQDPASLRLVPGDRETISQFDVFVFGSFDAALVPRSTQQAIADEVLSAGSGLAFICDPNLDPRRLAGTPLGNLLPIVLDRPPAAPWTYSGISRTWLPTPLGSTALPLQLAPPSNAEAFWRSLPGPQWIFGEPELKSGAQVLAQAVQTGAPTGPPLPLLISQFSGAGRVVVQTTDETYRWSSFRGGDQVYQRYWVQMLRWLSRGKLNRGDASELTVEPRRGLVGESLQFTAQLGAPALGALGSEPVRVRVQRPGTEERTLTLARVPNSVNIYKTSDNSLPAGSYRASIASPLEAQGASATFEILAPPGELASLRADWDALRQVAELTRGRFDTVENAQRLFDQLPPGTPVRRGTLPPQPLWNSPWVALAFVVLITSEWLLRRRSQML
jgi:hypothetical protein